MRSCLTIMRPQLSFNNPSVALRLETAHDFASCLQIKSMKLIKTSAAVALVCTLAACGGGGGGEAAPATPPAAPAPAAVVNTGSVSAAFVAGTSPRYQLAGLASQSFGAASTVVQDATGAVTKLAGVTLSGSPTATHEISGDTTYAQGRWVQGTVTSASGSTTLTGTSNDAYHYVAFNQLAALPTTGAPSCAAGRMTAPTYTSGGTPGSAANSGTATGTATLSFGATSTAITVSVAAQAGGSNGTVNGSSSISSSAQTGITGSYFGSGPGTQLAVGDGGTGKFIVVSAYKVTLANGANYQGVATFLCQ